MEKLWLYWDQPLFSIPDPNDQLCENPPCLHANFDPFLQFHNLYIIWGSIVEILVSVQKFPSFLSVQRK